MTMVWDKDLEMLVDKATLHNSRYRVSDKRSELPAPMVIRDTMAEIKSMADGKRYDSKRAYERGVRRKGCEVVGYEKDWQRHIPNRSKLVDEVLGVEMRHDTNKAYEIEAGKVPSYGPEARRLMRKQRKRERESIC